MGRHFRPEGQTGGASMGLAKRIDECVLGMRTMGKPAEGAPARRCLATHQRARASRAHLATQIGGRRRQRLFCSCIRPARLPSINRGRRRRAPRKRPRLWVIN